jgi:hypothetical protein
LFTPDTVLCASRDQVSTTIGAEAIILGMSSGVYHGVEGVGTRVWQLLQVPKRMGDVLAVVVAEYDVDSARAWDDLCALAADLVKHGLVTRDHATNP